MKHVLYFAVVAMVVFGVLYVVLHQQADAPESPVTPVATTTEVVPESPATPVVPDDIADHIASRADKIVMTSPAPYARISSPVTITGQARGPWFFEASFPIVIVNWDGLIIGEGYATADGEWMTTDFVPFTATVTFTADPDAYSDRGAIILQRDNPSDLPENDDALEVPIVFE